MYQPAFYTGDMETIEASFLLKIGWLGVFGGYPNWFANPIYLIAFVLQEKKPKISLGLAIAALILSFSFLLYRSFPINEAGGTSPIVGYGWGYYLWLMAIALFASAQARKCTWEPFERYTHVPVGYYLRHTFLIVGTISVAFFAHFYISNNGQNVLQTERAILFAARCAEATEMVMTSPRPVHGVYVYPDWDAMVGRNGSLGGGILGRSLVGRDDLAFYETRNESKSGKPIKRFYRAKDAKVEQVDEVVSEYSVITKSLTEGLRKELGIYGTQVLIIDNKTRRPIAEARYFVSLADKRVCLPNPDTDRFSTSEFARRVLKIGHK
jgi:hypothetical protein